MGETLKKNLPAGTEITKINVPTVTMAVIRKQARADGCSITHIVTILLNACARGEIKQGFCLAHPGAGR